MNELTKTLIDCCNVDEKKAGRVQQKKKKEEEAKEEKVKSAAKYRQL